VPPQPPSRTPAQRCAALTAALNQHRKTVCEEYDETLQEVIGNVAMAGSLGKTDLGALFFWKRIPTGPWVEKLLCMSESEVRRITAAAVTAAGFVRE
jgi:N-acetyl-anhydromuramyl-L-alanine amidase AmpD